MVLSALGKYGMIGEDEFLFKEKSRASLIWKGVL